MINLLLDSSYTGQAGIENGKWKIENGKLALFDFFLKLLPFCAGLRW